MKTKGCGGPKEKGGGSLKVDFWCSDERLAGYGQSWQFCIIRRREEKLCKQSFSTEPTESLLKGGCVLWRDLWPVLRVYPTKITESPGGLGRPRKVYQKINDNYGTWDGMADIEKLLL